MGLGRFLSIFLAIMTGSIIFSKLFDAVGFETYAMSTMGLLGISMLIMLAKIEISELAFWMIITYAGKNFEGGLYFLFFGMVLIYIFASAGFISVQRK